MTSTPVRTRGPLLSDLIMYTDFALYELSHGYNINYIEGQLKQYLYVDYFAINQKEKIRLKYTLIPLTSKTIGITWIIYNRKKTTVYWLYWLYCVY